MSGLDFRKKIVNENLAFLKKKTFLLNAWEKEFVESLFASVSKGYTKAETLSTKQFNTLQELVGKIR